MCLKKTVVLSVAGVVVVGVLSRADKGAEAELSTEASAIWKQKSPDREGLIEVVKQLQEQVASLRASDVPVGTIVAFGGACGGKNPPEGWLLCNGDALSSKVKKYKLLSIAIGQAWGDGSTNVKGEPVADCDFNLPDLQGRFLRGVDNGAGNDPDSGGRTASKPGGHTGDNAGSLQPDNLAKHQHNAQGGSGTLFAKLTTGPGQKLHWRERDKVSLWKSNMGFSYSGKVSGTEFYKGLEVGGATAKAGGALDSEDNRPVNCYVTYIIKY